MNVAFDSNIMDTVACLNCRKNHRKCDKQKPCSNCVKHKIECMINPKRKPIGRPTPQNNNIKKTRFYIDIELKCEKCDKECDVDSKFCSQCGSKLPEPVNYKMDQLIMENEMLKMKNEMLMKNIIPNKEEKMEDMWMMIKIFFPKDAKGVYPPPAFIQETSPSFLKALGYNSLNNFYFPKLIANKMQQNVDEKEIKIGFNLERVSGLMVNKLLFKQEFYLKQQNEKFMHVDINITCYIEPMTHLPTFATLNVVKFYEKDIEECNVPSKYILQKDFTLFLDANDDIPQFMGVNPLKNINNPNLVYQKRKLLDSLKKFSLNPNNNNTGNININSNFNLNLDKDFFSLTQDIFLSDNTVFSSEFNINNFLLNSSTASNKDGKRENIGNENVGNDGEDFFSSFLNS
eukprot:TRINITY_DN14331_c0_g1_i1.p1 TRINITY_DN14331_c0_g1~~TRINITY_DN14331_c0_g1_i1.p1  ORF type:complete len:402 (+),score=114.77 TRINITY_DN14331_c0_g1_i1:2-1207(+)